MTKYIQLAASPLASRGFVPRGNFKKISISGAAILCEVVPKKSPTPQQNSLKQPQEQ